MPVAAAGVQPDVHLPQRVLAAGDALHHEVVQPALDAGDAFQGVEAGVDRPVADGGVPVGGLGSPPSSAGASTISSVAVGTPVVPLEVCSVFSVQRSRFTPLPPDSFASINAARSASNTSFLRSARAMNRSKTSANASSSGR